MSAESDNVVASIRGHYPFPWQQVVFPNGEIKLIDAAGKEVALFSITALVVSVTEHMASK